MTNGNVEPLHRTILNECLASGLARYPYVRLTGLRRELEPASAFTNEKSNAACLLQPPLQEWVWVRVTDELKGGPLGL